MKDKVICEKYNNCPLDRKSDSCYHASLHYHINNCIPSKSATCRCGCCISMKDIRRLKLEKINENKV